MDFREYVLYICMIDDDDGDDDGSMIDKHRVYSYRLET